MMQWQNTNEFVDVCTKNFIDENIQKVQNIYFDHTRKKQQLILNTKMSMLYLKYLKMNLKNIKIKNPDLQIY